MAETVTLSPEAQEILESSANYTRSQDFLREMAQRDTQRDQDYSTCEQYYTGQQRTRLTDRAKKYLQVSGFVFCENFCEVIVDSLAERMILEGFDSESDELRTWGERFWKLNRMDAVQGIVHTNTAMKGDGYVILDVDTELNLPRVHYNRPEIIKPIYDSEHPSRIIAAAKVWKSQLETPTNPNRQGILRMNIYLPDRIEKWFRASKDAEGEWGKHLDPGDSVWPIEWLAPDGSPRGVPVFHFRNKSKGRSYGVSEIRGSIPQQDALNKQIIDLEMILDQQGWPQRWGTGVTSDDSKSFTGSVGTVWTAGSKDAKFGQFSAADPQGVLNAIEATLQRIAGRSRTPLHLMVLSGDAPSGESLKTAESGLIAKARDRCVPTGNTWEDVMIMAAGLAQETDRSISGIELQPDTFEALWRDPESRNELQHRQALEIEVTSLGVSKHTAQTQLGYDPDEEADKKQKEAEQAQRNFDRGLMGGSVPPFGGTAGQ